MTQKIATQRGRARVQAHHKTLTVICLHSLRKHQHHLNKCPCPVCLKSSSACLRHEGPSLYKLSMWSYKNYMCMPIANHGGFCDSRHHPTCNYIQQGQYWRLFLILQVFLRLIWVGWVTQNLDSKPEFAEDHFPFADSQSSHYRINEIVFSPELHLE